MANEDTRLELELCRLHQAQHILGICGSGGRLLPLAAVAPKSIVAVDLSAEQLHLAAMRFATCKQLSGRDFQAFWGFPTATSSPESAPRQKIFHNLALGAEARAYSQLLFERHDWQSLLYVGKWEKTITGIPKFLRRVIGNYYDEIFSFTDLQAQRAYFADRQHQTLWNLIPWLVLRLFGNSAYFNSMLYRGQHVRKNINQGYFEFYRDAFRRLFHNGLTRDNFFLQLCFLGCLRYPEGNPIEAQPEVYHAAQRALSNQCEYSLIQDDILCYAEKTSYKFDFVSLSDVPSYLNAEREKSYLQRLAQCLKPGALCVVRHYLRVPEQTDTSGYKDISGRYSELLSAEKMQMYDIKVYQYC